MGRGKLRLPLGHRRSVQNVLMCATKPRIWSADSESSNAGICDESPTPGPPFAIARSQSASGSGEVTEQSVKSIG